MPIAAEVLKAKGAYDPKRLFGVTTLDVVSGSFCEGFLLLSEPAIFLQSCGLSHEAWRLVEPYRGRPSMPEVT